MNMKLYMDPGSGSCRRVSAVLKYLNVDVQEVFVNLITGENRQEDFLAINPNGMVPVLTDDTAGGGTIVLSEASAIMIYVCEKFGRSDLWPTGGARFEVLKWMFWAAEHFRQPAPMYFEERFLAPLLGNDGNRSRLEEADRILAKHGPVLDDHLEGRDFVVGDHVTLADFDLAAPLSQMSRSGVPYDKYSNIMRWAENLERSVDAWRTTGKRLNARMDGVNS